MGGRKEWGSRQWPFVLLPECCAACKDGFVLKNHLPMYIWGCVRGSAMLAWGVDTFLTVPVLFKD